jgi:hypothetical protein
MKTGLLSLLIICLLAGNYILILIILKSFIIELNCYLDKALSACETGAALSFKASNGKT